jgi:DNA-binding transcriptional LysR family regulator
MPFDLPSRLRRQTLFQDRLVVIARTGHPEMRRGVTMELYARLGHVGFLSRGTSMFQAMVDKDPAVHREKKVSVANMGLVPRLVASSNYIATISTRCALQFQERFPIELHDCPFEVKLFPVEMIWHQRDDADPAHSWLRQSLAEIGAEIDRQPLDLVAARAEPARRAQSPVEASERAR